MIRLSPQELTTSMIERVSAERELPVSTLARLRRTAGTALGGGKLVVDRVVLREPDLRTLGAIVSALGELKGVAMKVGQVLSYIDSTLPADTRTALAVLQTHAHPLPYSKVCAVADADLGPLALQLFASMEPKPIAVGSIGQVHRAKLPGNIPVAVKVQYSQIEEAIEDDFRQAAFGSTFISFFYPSAKQFVRDAKGRFLEECDYEREGAQQQAFADLYHDHPTITVPKVFGDYSARHVLTSAFVEGKHLDAYLATNPTQEARDRAGQAIYDFYVGSIFRFARYNCDPHPGNYLFTADGKVAFIDFGCSAELDKRFVSQLSALVKAVHEGNNSDLKKAMVDMGIMVESERSDSDATRRLMHAFCGLLRDEHNAIEPGTSARIQDTLKNTWKLARLSLPGEFIFLMRLRLGVTSVLSRLGARANWYRREVEHVDARIAMDEAALGKFDVVLLAVGPAPILVIREVRAATGLDLRQATELVNGGPNAILSKVSKKIADNAREKLAATGCSVEVRTAS